MLRTNFTFFLLVLFVSGCASDPLQLPYPQLSSVPERLALGASVELLLVHDDERDAEPGQLIRVDALGVAEDGTTVDGMKPSTTNRSLLLPMAYEYDPAADVRTVEVTAAGFTEVLRFRGTVTYEPLFWENQ